MIRETQLHATTVELEGRGLLILGPSGAGKSTLALQLMATGCRLVSDDRTDLRCEGARIFATAPSQLSGRIEARFVGILNAEPAGRVQIQLVVDLGGDPEMRLPPQKQHNILGVSLPLVLSHYRPHLYAALRQYLIAGRRD